MNANGARLKHLIATGEGIDREFKTCRKALSRTVYQTVCAFLNRQGGHLFLGVEDDGKIRASLPPRSRVFAGTLPPRSTTHRS